MANLDLTTVGLIVEKNMRDIGMYKGELEKGWKSTIDGSDGVTYEMKSNLKNLRDIIAQSIIDILSNVTANGTLSVSNTQGSPSKTVVNNKITLNGKAMSGIGDAIQINATTQKDLFVWIGVVSAFINAIAPGTCIPPTVINGKITGGG